MRSAGISLESGSPRFGQEEAFLFGRQDGKCFADQLWTFSTLAEGDTSADVPASLEDLYQTRN